MTEELNHDEAADMPQQEREFLRGLRWIEKRAILPLKWASLVIAVAFWILSRPGNWAPAVEVFALFTFYFMYNAGESYLFWFSRVSVHQVWAVCFVSYLVDLVFVTLLVYFDAHRYPAPDGPATDFYVFYFLMILRGVALFRTPRGNLAANALVGAAYAISLLWQDPTPEWYTAQNNVIRAVFIGLVIMMAWFIVSIINQQKEELMRAREDLVRSENLAALGELAAGVAHEINNPIGIISAYAEFLDKNARKDDPRREDYQTIYKEARRCERIVGELLNYARPTAPGRSSVDLTVLTDEVLTFVSHRPGAESVQVVRDYPEQVPTLLLEPGVMKQALLNIVLNAYQAMEKKGGVLRISFRVEPMWGRVRLRIEDTGRGISQEQLKRVFDPFFTTRHGGTGLGLAITRRIVEAQGGRIEINSVPGEGTTVDLIFPLDPTVVE